MGFMSSARILVVEDEQLVALDIKHSLESFGYKVVDTVSSGEMAITQANALRPDLVFMDIMIEGPIDGITAAAQIKDSLDIPIIYLTSYSDDATLRRARVTESYGYILKPFETSELRVATEMSLFKHEINKQRSGRIAPLLRPLATTNNGIDKEPRPDSFEILDSMNMFSCVNEADKRRLAELSEICQIRSGRIIANEGDQALKAFVVVSGRVAMLKSSPNGKQFIVELLAEGDLLGLVGVVEHSPMSTTIRAQSDCILMMLPKATLIMLMETYPELYRRFVAYIAKRLSASHNLLRGLAHDHVEKRIAAALFELATRFGTYDTSGTTCTVEITRQEMADLTGTSVETTIRVTRMLEEAGILKLDRRKHIQIMDMSSIRNLTKNAAAST